MTSPSLRRLLLVASASLLPNPPGIDLRFDPCVAAEAATRWEEVARAEWKALAERFVVRPPAPRLVVGITEVTGMPRDVGRTRQGRIELNALLPHDDSDQVLRHEIAHVFFEGQCPTAAAAAPLLSESFALFASGDAARRSLAGTRFVFESEARTWLLTHATDPAPDSGRLQDALSRILARADDAATWEAHFRSILRNCNAEDFATSLALARTLDLVRQPAIARVFTRTDFLLLDGRSQEILAREGDPLARHPTGSILKPSLVAAIPELLEPRRARRAAEWRCPDAPRGGELWTWQKALARSCNGFFLDSARAGPESYSVWRDDLERLGFEGVPTAEEGRIGLTTGFTLSTIEVSRLYAWNVRSAPFVVEALRETAVSGTLARAAGARWFREHGVALKSGSVRSATNEPLHSWIVAVGPRGPGGAASFIAVLHAAGRATSTLLPELRERLSPHLASLARGAETQILGLVPPTSVTFACEGGAPALIRSTTGVWRIEGREASFPAQRLSSGSAMSCLGDRLVASFPDRVSGTKQRFYDGTLEIQELASPVHSSPVPLRARSARARAGSRFVLRTSERRYVESVLLSEYPDGTRATLEALALIVRNNLEASRHVGRPCCDTTHCQVFGHDGSAPSSARLRVREAMAAVNDTEIASPQGGRRWLPFSLGGSSAWTDSRSSWMIREALDLEADPTTISRRGAALEIVAGMPQRFPCDLVRNQLRLPSCPDEAVAESGGFLFRGRGEGHGAGLDLSVADDLARSGSSREQILGRFFPGLRLRPRT